MNVTGTRSLKERLLTATDRDKRKYRRRRASILESFGSDVPPSTAAHGSHRQLLADNSPPSTCGGHLVAALSACLIFHFVQCQFPLQAVSHF